MAFMFSYLIKSHLLEALFRNKIWDIVCVCVCVSFTMFVCARGHIRETAGRN